jgi:hypothetical protein
MEDLLGKEIRGFRFIGNPHSVNYNMSMNKYIGVIGKIKSVRNDSVTVIFPNHDTWSYPHKEALHNLVKEELEEEQSIGQILNNIKNLTKDL